MYMFVRSSPKSQCILYNIFDDDHIFKSDLKSQSRVSGSYNSIYCRSGLDTFATDRRDNNPSAVVTFYIPSKKYYFISDFIF